MTLTEGTGSVDTVAVDIHNVDTMVADIHDMDTVILTNQSVDTGTGFKFLCLNVC